MYGDGSVMQVDDLLNDGQSQTVSGRGMGSITLIKFVKEMLEDFVRQLCSFVCYLEDDLLRGFTDEDSDGTALRRKF